jgi:hypothetical protein
MQEEALRRKKQGEVEGLRPTTLKEQEAHASGLEEREQACQGRRTP